MEMKNELRNKKCLFSQQGKKKCQKECIESSLFCIVHQPLTGERVKCENCQQMILQTSFNYHDKVCSKKSKPEEIYYSYKVNDPSKIILPALTLNEEEKEEEEEEEVNVNQLIRKIEEIYETFLFPMLGPRKQNKEIDNNLPHPPSLNPSNKHRSQELMMLNQILSHEMISTNKSNIFLDLGSGKGCLSKTISSSQEVGSDSIFVCIEKSTYKHKAERNDKCLTFRKQINLEDVLIEKLIESVLSDERTLTRMNHNNNNSQKNNDNYSIIGMGKHLCGNATDIAIVSLTNIQSVSGICIALCCHSNCQFNSTLATKWLNSLPTQQQITRNEWKYLKKWAGTFSLNDREKQLDQERRVEESKVQEVSEVQEVQEAVVEVDQRDMVNEMLYEERVTLGLKCKRIIDYGRVVYLQQEMRMNAKLVYYVEEEVTPENVLLLAWK